MSKMSLEELFRKHLSDYREVPGAEVWSRLSQSLEARKRRRRLAWWMSSAALLVVLTAFTLWLRHDYRKLFLSENNTVLSSHSLSENVLREKNSALNKQISTRNDGEERLSDSEQARVYQNVTSIERANRQLSSRFNVRALDRKEHVSNENLQEKGFVSIEKPDDNTGIIIPESLPSATQFGKSTSESELKVSEKNPVDASDLSGKLERNPLDDIDVQQQEKCVRYLPFFIGLSYEAGSLWRTNPINAEPGLWMPADNVETLPGTKSAKATSFSDVIQAIHITGGYRLSDVLSVHMSLGHTRVRHFESGNLLNRVLPPGGELGLMTSTGAFRVGSEAVSDSSINLRKLAQHFSFVTLTPGVTYNLNLKQWVLGFNTGIQMHFLVSNRGEATFAHTTHTYRHEGLRPFSASINAGLSVGYRIQRLVLSVGFQGGYWMTPLSRRGFAGARYLQMGIRPSVIYNF